MKSSAKTPEAYLKSLPPERREAIAAVPVERYLKIYEKLRNRKT